jgi:hypothetical protein
MSLNNINNDNLNNNIPFLSKGIWVLSLIFLLPLFINKAVAENSSFQSLFNQWVKNQYCSEVTTDDIRAFKCDSTGLLKAMDNKNLEQTGHQVFDWLVFQEAVRMQVPKDKCIYEQITQDLMTNLPEHNKPNCNPWKQYLGINWLRARKAKLVYAACRGILNMVSSRAHKYRELKNFTPDKSFENLLKNWQPENKNEKPLINIEALKKRCYGEDQMEILYASQSLFQLAVPVISSPDLFEVVEKNRGAIKSLRNNSEPLTDLEIVNMDLGDFTNKVDIDCKGQFNVEVDSVLKSYADHRLKSAQKLEAKRNPKNDTYNLDSEDRDYLFADDTVTQVLKDNDVFENPSMTKTKYRTEKRLSNAAACLISQYEPTMAGSLIEFGGLSVFEGALLFKIFSGLKLFKYVDKNGELKHIINLSATSSKKKNFLMALDMGMLKVGAPDMKVGIEQLLKICFPKLRDVTEEPGLSSRSNAGNINILGAELPKPLGFKKYDEIIDLTKTPSCKNPKLRDWNRDSIQNANCFLAAAPMFMGRSGILAMPVFNSAQSGE